MNTELRFHIIHDFSQLEEHMPQLESSKVFGVDTETTGLDPFQDQIRLVQVATRDNLVIIFDMQKIDESTRTFLRDILSGNAIKVFQNAKFDLKFLHQSGLPVSGRIFDTFIAGNLLRQKSRLTRFGLDSLAQHYLGVQLSKEQQASDWHADLSLEQYEYAAHDAAILIPLREAMIKDLQSEGLMDITKLELACLPAVVQMELTGIQLNLDRWQRLGEHLERQRDAAAAELFKNLYRSSIQLNLFGEDTHTSLNLDSQQQVLKALKEHGVPLRNTSRNQLAPLAGKYPVVQQLLEYRRAAKSLQAFIYSIPQALHPVTGRLHPRYHQMGASTGRFSCGHPNLQQIPRSKDFRSCFVARPGHKLVIADYSQIELRVVAEISRDTTMIQAYATGQDLHRLTASLVANKPIDEVSKQERQAAKAVNFGLVYAMGARGLQAYAQSTYGVTMTLDEAELFRKRFFAAYAGVANWHKSVKMSKERVSHTLGGRKYRWRDTASLTGLYNWPVQGTAADIVKQAMADLMPALQNSDTKIIGMIHDEIILESPESDAHSTAKILKETMEAAGAKYLQFVPVLAETLVADNWAEK